ncbi:hypothetical protein MTR62_03005 [Novosphingobium sp. 1949]|uniref:Uncharacterized protein n=1 Tax=Novosphingobium organovorum TaxID=2930092 RepID=A0ABT0BA29_9SPHN|nr:hypothetical protein [Novosphingobium organovorum]MCJ2181681.1 hypothetical protein [Novosphingobium organovorum]
MSKRIVERVGALASAVTLALAPVVASAAASAAVPAPVAAPAVAGTPAKNPDTKNVMLYLDVFYAALHSDKVDHTVKQRLVGCLYDNSLHKITTAMDNTIAQNAGKVHLDKPNEVLDVMALICGYKPKAAAAAAKAPAKAGPGMKGR